MMKISMPMIQVANDFLSMIEYCGIDRNGYTGFNHNIDDDDDNNNYNNNDRCIPTMMKTTLLCDVELIGTDGIVLGCRVLLACRSPILFRMLYNITTTTATTTTTTNSSCKGQLILGYKMIVLETIVYYCSYNTINPLFPKTLKNENSNDDNDFDHHHDENLLLIIQLLQAADYLQLTHFYSMICHEILFPIMSSSSTTSKSSSSSNNAICTLFQYISPYMMNVPIRKNHVLTATTSTTEPTTTSTVPSSTTSVTETTTLSSSLSSSSCTLSVYDRILQMIEIRPYITLDPNNTFSQHILQYNKYSQTNASNNNISNNHNCTEVNECMNNNNNNDTITAGNGLGGGITILSVDKVEIILQSKHNLHASEYFVFVQLLRWYQYQIQLLSAQQLSNQQVVQNNNDDDDIILLQTTTKALIKQYIELSYIEPHHLLYLLHNNDTTNNNNIATVLSSEHVYMAISQQALRASQTKVWYLPYCNGGSNGNGNSTNSATTTTTTTTTSKNGTTSTTGATPKTVLTTTTTTTTIPDRVLVEGSGCMDVNGMYYRINTTSSTTTTATGTNTGSRLNGNERLTTVTTASSVGDGSSISTTSNNRRGIATTTTTTTSSRYLVNAASTTGNMKNALYTKREVMVGQPNVYTLSRCLKYRRRKNKNEVDMNAELFANTSDSGSDNGDTLVMTTANIDGNLVDSDNTEVQINGNNNNNNNVVDNNVDVDYELEAYYECRIFSSPFLTYSAVRQLQIMQMTTTIIPSYQPVMQLLDFSLPANQSTTTNNINNNNMNASTDGLSSMSRSNSMLDMQNIINYSNNVTIPTPIRKYYRIRISDGEYHMPGTLAPELNGLIERNELDVHRVLQILEFGVYTTYGCASIHILKAIVVTGNSTPIHVFGNPIPLEETAPINVNDTDDLLRQINNNKDGRLQNLYYAEVIVPPETDDPQRNNIGPLTSDNDMSTSLSSFYASGCIPKKGWDIDVHGIEPVPECTWIPSSSSTTTKAIVDRPTNTSNNTSLSTSSNKHRSSSTSRVRDTSTDHRTVPLSTRPQQQQQQQENTLIADEDSTNVSIRSEIIHRTTSSRNRNPTSRVVSPSSNSSIVSEPPMSTRQYRTLDDSDGTHI